MYIEEVRNGVRTITGVPTSITAFIGRALRGPVDLDEASPVRLVSFADYERIFGGLWADSPMSFAVCHYFLNGGSEALVVRVDNDGSAIGTQISDPGLRATRQGIYALDKADIFNLLCIPPFSATADVDKTTWDAAVGYATQRRAMVIVDPPYHTAGWHTAEDVTAANAITNVVSRSEDAALFFPRIRAANPLSENRPEPFAPCGAVAGVIARTDAAHGVWKLPAGNAATLSGVLALDVSLTDTQNAAINPLGVNCLRRLPATGPVVWGSRTLDRPASEWKYLAVRRLALFLEESLYRGTRWAVSEPNDEALWAQIRLSIGAFMHDLFRQGAFQGRTPDEAYFVRCDATTMTQADMDAGVVNIIVGFAPMKPAEFVVIKVQQIGVGQ